MDINEHLVEASHGETHVYEEEDEQWSSAGGREESTSPCPHALPCLSGFLLGKAS